MSNATNVKTSFDNIVKVYEESSLLLKDLIAEIEKKGFRKKRGNEIGSYISKHIDAPKNWFARYATLFFEAIGSKYSLSATIIYFDDLEPFKPCLIMGVIKNIDGNTKNYNWWMDNVFFNRENKFSYYGKDNKNIESPHLDWQKEGNEWVFERRHDEATSYPEDGKLFAVPLLEIKREGIGGLAKRVLKLRDEGFVWDETD